MSTVNGKDISNAAEALKPNGAHWVASPKVRCLNVDDSARFLGIGRRSLYRLVERGTLRPVCLPGLRKWVFDVRDLEALIEEGKRA